MNPSQVLTLIVLFFAFSGHAQLQIDHAYCGAQGSWRDVTPLLQNHLASNTVSASIAQPFDHIGGDPAPSQPKIVIVEYHYDGKP